MRKILIGAAIWLLAINSYAFRIISIKHTQSPNVVSWLERHENPTSLHPFHVTSYASIGDAHGKLNEYLDLISSHWIRLQNISESTKRYKYVYFLSCGNAQSSYEFEIELKPHEEHRESAENHVTFQSEYLGDFVSTSSTTISGAESNEFINHGTVYIKNK